MSNTQQKSLTDEQKARLEVLRNWWVDFVQNGDIHIKNAKEEVDWLYGYAGLAAPDLVEVRSPLAAQIQVHLIADDEIFALIQDPKECPKVLKALGKVLEKKHKVKIS